MGISSSAAPGCLHLGAEFLSEQFYHYFRLERPNSFSSGLSSEILHFTGQFLISRAACPQRSWPLGQEGEGPSLARDPWGEEM